MKSIAQKTLFVLIGSMLLLLVLEMALRPFGRPYGDFAGLFSEGESLNPVYGTTIRNWGPIPYVVEFNNQGFRGEDFPLRKPPGTLRILTIGDSVTHGFYVDNAATWQYPLEAMLIERLGRHVEVINGARAGGSIDKELRILQRFAPRLKPDVVILTFVSNDINGIRYKGMKDLLRSDPALEREAAATAFPEFFFVDTALGEFAFHAYLTLVSSTYRERLDPDRDAQPEEIKADESRYLIAGGENFEQNAALFDEKFGHNDGVVLGESFAPEIETAFAKYRILLEKFASVCRENEAKLLFAYYPAYPQIYDSTASLFINERLRSLTAELGIAFFDLTDGFRAEGESRVLHLAPLDFHPNPEGNRVLARLFADHLTQVFLPKADLAQ